MYLQIYIYRTQYCIKKLLASALLSDDPDVRKSFNFYQLARQQVKRRNEDYLINDTTRKRVTRDQIDEKINTVYRLNLFGKISQNQGDVKANKQELINFKAFSSPLQFSGKRGPSTDKQLLLQERQGARPVTFIRKMPLKIVTNRYKLFKIVRNS